MRSVHATPDEIYRAINRIDPRASRATVYNNLHALVRAGLIQEVSVGGKSVRFDANLQRHHHFVCERCGRVEDIAWFDLPPLDEVRRWVRESSGITRWCSGGFANVVPSR